MVVLMPRRTVHTATLHAVLPFGTDGAVPEWVQLVPAGTFSGVDGRGPYSVPDAAALITASMAAGPLVIDEAHATDHGLKSGLPSPAQGWIVELQARADGIWGRVEWTPPGREKLATKLYRGISPVFTHSKSGQLQELLRAGLTNAPNLPLAALNAQQETTMELMAKLCQALGLAATADEAAVLAAVEAHGKAVALQAKVAGALGLGADATETAIVTALQARTAAGADAEKHRADMVAMQAQLQTLQSGIAKGKAETAIDGAIRDGKPIPKTLRDHYIARHMADPASVEKELAALPSLHAGGVGARSTAEPGVPEPKQLALQAQQLQDKERAAGRDISFAEAVQRASAAAAAA